MTEMTLLDGLGFICALGCGLVAGFLYAFSVCVMRALERIQPSQAIAAMQSINVVVINPCFLSVFFGTAFACVAMVVESLSRWHDPRAPFWFAGGVLYVLGTIVVTMLFNVPRNNRLAALAPLQADAGDVWRAYVLSWTKWNHVRTLTAFAAAASFTYGIAFA